ncbi:hypothetical protein YC2023_037069 [Brassica napus]
MCSREWRDLEVNKNSVWFRILYLMESSTSINGNLFYRERTETVKARVWHKRRDNYTIIGSSSGNLAVNVNLFRGISDVSRLPLRGANDNPGGLTDGAAYWENILGQGEVTTGQQFLLGVCTDDDDTTELRNPRLTQGKSPFADALETSEGTESSTDSSAAPLNAFPQIAGSGVIRLKEGIHQPVNPYVIKISATLSIGTQKSPPSILDYITKGKGKVSEVGVVDRTQVSASGGSLSPNRNPNFADPLPYDDSADEGEVVSVGVAQELVGGAEERITTVPPVKGQYEKGANGMKSFGKGLMWGDRFSLFNNPVLLIDAASSVDVSN